MVERIPTLGLLGTNFGIRAVYESEVDLGSAPLVFGLLGGCHGSALSYGVFPLCFILLLLLLNLDIVTEVVPPRCLVEASVSLRAVLLALKVSDLTGIGWSDDSSLIDPRLH